MEFSEKSSSFDLSLFLRFQLTFPEREKERCPLNWPELPAAHNRSHSSKAEAKQEKEYLRGRLVENTALGIFVGVCPHRDKKAKVGL